MRRDRLVITTSRGDPTRRANDCTFCKCCAATWNCAASIWNEYGIPLLFCVLPPNHPSLVEHTHLVRIFDLYHYSPGERALQIRYLGRRRRFAYKQAHLHGRENPVIDSTARGRPHTRTAKTALGPTLILSDISFV